MPLAGVPADIVTELWVSIEGYEDLYEVSTLGRVRTIAGGMGRMYGRILKPKPQRKGYRTVILWRNAETLTRYIHHLVLEAFVGPALGRVVHHKDENKANNALSNLEYLDDMDHRLLHRGR